ncbi:protein UNIFOLIATA-like [Abrus precatorius]|uniref:Floricaula/leafy-like transcription factor n=1 Tax=Abrus precatorius TaxID=3816 RepID=A0A8B8KJ49_ABRPR|nr:protein UNIFOLIATA-like [Abrus precatorius]
MDQDAFTSNNLFKWDPRTFLPMAPCTRVPLLEYSIAPPRAPTELEDLFRAYGVRYHTAAKVAELGFTVSTLVNMMEEELDDMINSLSHIFRWDLLFGERYGIKAAVRAQRRRIHGDDMRRRNLNDGTTINALDALSQEGLSKEAIVEQEKEVIGNRGGSAWGVVSGGERRKQQNRRRRRRRKMNEHDGDLEEAEEEEGEGDDDGGNNNSGCVRQREHPFIVTEPGEVARGKKNGLDYLFHLYDQCRDFLIQVQNIAKNRGEKCPTKVTNEVFRYAKKAGASYINKPKMRHYVHCYALHCLDEQASNELRRALKERGENVGAWRQACYKPLVAIASLQGWDIDAIFNSHPRLSIWYVPTKLRQLCHAQRNTNVAPSSLSVATAHLPF